ncbi:hypothetical protein J6590_075799 [Homalodisca vitripennis]|nr:hypothetical protein J6590_075799 [Homalodisca vitripennis]
MTEFDRMVELGKARTAQQKHTIRYPPTKVKMTEFDRMVELGKAEPGRMELGKARTAGRSKLLLN